MQVDIAWQSQLQHALLCIGGQRQQMRVIAGRVACRFTGGHGERAGQAGSAGQEFFHAVSACGCSAWGKGAR